MTRVAHDARRELLDATYASVKGKDNSGLTLRCRSDSEATMPLQGLLGFGDSGVFNFGGLHAQLEGFSTRLL